MDTTHLEPLKWHTEKHKVDDLIPHPKNPHTGTEKEDQDLEASVTKFDLVEIPGR